MRGETRFRMVEKQDPERFKMLQAAARKNAFQRVAVYQQLSNLTVPNAAPPEESQAEAAAAKTEA
jgi:hypothetical protein